MNDAEKKVIGDSWNGLLEVINTGYKAGLIGDVNSSIAVNSYVSTIDALVKKALSEKDCGCSGKEAPVDPTPQPVARVQNLG